MCVCLYIDLIQDNCLIKKKKIIQDNCSLLIELIIINGYVTWIEENLTIIEEKYYILNNFTTNPKWWAVIGCYEWTKK